MEHLEKVYDKIDKAGIKTFNFKIPGSKATIESEGQYGIFVDYEKLEDSQEEFMVLAHEYGHCKSGSTHVLNSPCDLIAKHEFKADKTAVFEFLPIEKIHESILYGCRNIQEIADYLDFPPKFVKRAIEIYTTKEML